MTPLARLLFKDMLRRPSERHGADEIGILRKLDDIHCFDLSDAWPINRDLAWKFDQGQKIEGRLAFLPAPKTWIEFSSHDDQYVSRIGYLLIESAGAASATIYFAAWGHDESDPRGYYITGQHLALALQQPSIPPALYRGVHTENGEEAEEPEVPSSPALLYAALALINSPRIIGRRQHMPHRGLERRLVNAMKPVGKFPVHAWTEIKLEIAPPRDLSDEESKEAHLTGRKALHFCRAHLRIRRGQLEFVRSHWRGDAFLGIKQSRYRVVPGRSSTPAAGRSASVAKSGHQASDP